MSVRPRNPSLAQLYRDFADRWEIEPVPPGTKWIGVLREMDEGDVTIVLGHDIGGLRFGMTGIERETPTRTNPDRGHEPAALTRQAQLVLDRVLGTDPAEG